MEIIAQRFDAPAPTGAPPGARATAHAHAGHRPSAVRFSVVSTLDDLEALGPEWDRLYEAYGAPHQVFQTFAWLRIWASLYVGRGTRLATIIGRVGDRLVLVWPLVVQTSFGVRLLTGMGDPLSQYTDALMAPALDDVDHDAAYEFAARLPADAIVLRRVRDDAALAPMMRRHHGEGINRQAAPVVELADVGSAKAFEDRFPGKVRASRRRRRRRLEERGPVRFDHYAPSADAAALVPVALGFKRDWARRHGIVAPGLFDPRFERFFVAAASAGDAACAGDQAPALRVSALRCGEDILAVEISVACKGRLFGHVLASRPDAAPLGVGGVLAEAILTNAIARGYSGVDLLAPADAYKREWTETCVGVGDYVVARTLRGVLYTRLWVGGARDPAKRIAIGLRPAVAAVRGWARSHR